MASVERGIEAFRLRASGLSYRKVGEYMNVGPSYAHTLSKCGERVFNACRQHLAPGLSIETADVRDIEIARLKLRVAVLERELERARR